MTSFNGDDVPVLCVARNVACNIRGGYFKDFDGGLLQCISKVTYEDDINKVPSAPDVRNYLISEDEPSAVNGNKDSLRFDGMADNEVETRLKCNRFDRMADNEIERRLKAWYLSDPDAEKVFKALRVAGVKLVVVSNFDTQLRPVLMALNCYHWFNAVAVSAEVEAEKPNPTIFLKACELLEVNPDDAVHVGDDRRNDIWNCSPPNHAGPAFLRKRQSIRMVDHWIRSLQIQLGSRDTAGNRTATPRSSREPTPEGNTSPPPPSVEGSTAEVFASMQRAIEGLADRLDRQEMGDQRNAAQPQPQFQAPVQTYNCGNKEVSLQEFLKLKSLKFTGSDSSADPQSFLDGTFKALRALGCSSERAVELALYKLEDMANT
ncbi:RNA polymerase II C-terminal domain phosphatase-like 2 [Capsicum baccatum]|uniref:RNA polymerase II C-terminal domain phosphatase-like 2 n=1 Tax=Capsicum baccatum TaxID=33114 RepID=A0A2G2VHK0_CAPBA|nr:RNA polymerase II C-terminal domain phosphatase-like 2 [Capsicum baccatum]